MKGNLKKAVETNMPRQPRIDLPGILYHVIVRGIERRKIFRDAKDKKIFLSRMSALIEECEVRCYAWSLLSNHFHLLMMPTTIRLQTFMHRLLTGYAVNFNIRHKRSGHLFQNRYKAIICQKESYFINLVRYIHLNPLRAGIVNDVEQLDEYLWSGHSTLIGKKERSWQHVDEVLRIFNRKKNKAQKQYWQFVADGIAEGRQQEYQGGGLRRSLGNKLKKLERDEEYWQCDDRILGDGNFVEEVLQRAEIQQTKLEKLNRRGWDWKKLALKVCQEMGIDPKSIEKRRRGNKAAQAKAIIACIARNELGMQITQIAKMIGITQSGASRLIEKGRLHAKDLRIELA